MKRFFLKIVVFIKQYPSVLYSFLLILVLPIALYYNTFSVAESFQSDIDRSLQTKALITENILGEFLADFLDNPGEIQKKIDKIITENSEIKGLSILKEEQGEFTVLASNNSVEIGGKTQDPSFILSFSQDQAIANLAEKNGERVWNVIKPIYDKETGDKKGLIKISLSLEDSDVLITKTIFKSFIIVFVIIILTLFLIFQHTRLFGYVALSKKLQDIDKMKDDFIRMTTHELRSPIVSIRGYIDILEDDLKKTLTGRQKESFEKVKISSKNLNDLISDILEVSRIQQGQLDFNSKIISPSKKINEIIKELTMKAEQKGLSLIAEIDKGNYYINVNPERFRQVLVNLIENSIKYTFEGQISIKTIAEEIKQRYIIEIKDTGVGISAEAQKKLFSRFYRVKTKKTALVPGTGLGLWITKKLCQKMKGEIFVESMEGAGTKFTIIFPLFIKPKNKLKNKPISKSVLE
ncbi:MAG: HAMP domain-containing sensor histidine kinase [Candidatus Nealsonbacteria bacterium]